MTKRFWHHLPRPIVGLAPMDGFTDSAFRQICRALAPDIVLFTEFTSAEGLAHDAARIKERFWFEPAEQPLVAQLFGNDVPSFIRAAQWLEAQGFSGIDLNMGCPSRAVVRSESGIALRKDHDRAFRIVDAVATHTALPVSVKTRLGLTDGSDLVTFGAGCENAGANLLTVHGRTYAQPYSAPADFGPIETLRRAVAIPVLGNGGITSRADGAAKAARLDGFLVGRAAIGNPWVFVDRQLAAFSEKHATIVRHAELLVAARGEVYGVREMRKHLVAYVRWLPNARALRQACTRVNTLQDIRTLFPC